MNDPELSRGWDNLGGRVNTLAPLTRTTLGVVSVTKCLDLGIKAEICIKEVKINFAKPTVIEWQKM